MAGSSSSDRTFFTDLIRSKPLTPFCVYHSMKNMDCSEVDHDDGDQPQDVLNESNVSLFDSPTPQLIKPLLKDFTQIVTPIKHKSTPSLLHVDCNNEKVWSPAMATPSCQRTIASSAERTCSTDQSNLSNAIMSGSGHSTSSKERTKGRVRFQLAEPLVRRLFHNDGETTPIAQPTNAQPFSEDGVSILNCTDCENIMDSSSQLSTDLFVSPKKCDHDNTISDVCVTPPTCESGSTSSFVNSTLSLDVLFMSNSQLDALEERRSNDHTPLQVSAETEMCTNSVVDDHVHNESKGDHTSSEATSDHTLCQSKENNDDCTHIQLEIPDQSFTEIDNHTLCQPISDHSQSKETISDGTHNKSISDHTYNQSVSDHTYNQSIIKDTEIKTSRSKKFIYPKSVKVSSLPVKRPPSYELPHLKKRPNLSLPRQPMSEMTTPIQCKRTNETTAGENGRPSSYESTPFGRPNKSSKFNLKDNKVFDRSTEYDIKNNRDCVSEFHPELTSTPSIDKADNKKKFTVGFRTLSGKDVVPSSAAIERAKCMIENIERDIVEHLNEKCMSTDEEILPLKNERLLNDELQNEKVIDKDLTTPSSDSIKVEEEMTDTQYIQGLLPAGIDWEEFSTFTQIPTKEENPLLLTNKDVPADVSDTPTKCLTDTTPTIPPVFGFTTASGHNVQISETAIESAKKLLFTQDDQNNVGMPDLQTTPTCVGFATAAGRKIEISKESLDRANKLLAKPTDTPIDNYMDIDKQPTKGNLSFTTASGKAIPEEPLDKVRSLLDTPPNNEENATPPKDFASRRDESSASIAPALGFKTAAGNVVSVSEDSLYKAKSLLSDEVPPTALGFSTASGRDVTVSEKSLQAVKSLFDDQSNTAVTSVFSTASGREVTVSEKSLQAVKSLFDDQSNTAVTSVFSTASGRDVTVSEKSLQAVKSLFDDQSNTTVTSVFSTASGRDVTVSEKSLQAVKSLFDDQSNTTVTSVFSTASGRDVTVSEKSLQAVKSLFDDQSNTAVTSVFSTASGRDVTVSEKSLQAVKSLFDDCETTPIQQTTPSTGLETSQLKTTLDGIESSSNEAPPITTPTKVDRYAKKMSFLSVPEAVLYDRNRSFKPKQSVSRTPEATPIATPTHVKFQSNTGTCNYGDDHTSKEVCPVWKPPSSPVCSTAHIEATPPHAYHLDFSSTQLLNFTEMSPLSPTTLNSSTFCHLESTTLNKAPLPLIVREAGQEVCRQEGTITRARKRSGCQRIPMVAMVTRGRAPGGYSREELLTKGVPPSLFSITAATCKDFVFAGRDYFSAASLKRGWVCVGDGVILELREDGAAGIDELWKSFSVSPGVDSKLISFKWFCNHYQLVVWKLAMLEVCFPDIWAGRALSVDWFMMQMKHRYDIEIDQAKRSILHKICEGDDTPTRLMVLCVQEIVAKEKDNELSYSLKLTDGWYCINAMLDMPLSSFVGRGLIKVGGKLLVCGAKLSGNDTLGHPLEVIEGKSLLLCANSVRRAHWACRLGLLLPRPTPPIFALDSLIAQGGVAPSVKVIIARRYPMLYVERLSDGRRAFRGRNEEEKIVKECQEERQRKIEIIHDRIEKEFEHELEMQLKQKKRRSIRLTSRSIKQLQDGEDIYSHMQTTSDPDAFLQMLSSTQRALLESYRVAMATQRQEHFQSRLKKALEEAEESELPPTRKVSVLLRLLLVQYSSTHSPTNCLMSIWNCNNELQDSLKEGTPLRIDNVLVQNYHEGRLQLSSVRSTNYKLLSNVPSNMINYQPRNYTPISSIPAATISYFNELDTVGMIVTCTAQQINDNKSITNIYLTDPDGSLLIIKVWEGIKTLSLENIIKAGQVVAISNLHHHRYRGSSGPHTATVTDRTIFSQNPSEGHLLEALFEFKNKLPSDISQLLQSMTDIISEL